MDFTQVIKHEHARANEILDRLADSSDTALKMRERLGSQLAELLEEHARKEEAFLYPAFERHQDANNEMRSFLDGARRAHEEIRRLAGEIARMAKDDEDFAPRVNELKKAAHPHMREEERLLGALRKALAENELAEIEQALASGAEEAVERLSDMASAATRQAADLATAGAKRLRKEVAEEAERGSRAVLAAAEIYSDAAHVTAEDLQAIATYSTIAAGGMGEMRQAWMDWLSRSLQTGARASRDLLRCTTIEQLADVQRSFFKESLENFLAGGVQMLRISSRISEDAARPIEDRMSHLRTRTGTEEETRPGAE